MAPDGHGRRRIGGARGVHHFPIASALTIAALPLGLQAYAAPTLRPCDPLSGRGGGAAHWEARSIREIVFFQSGDKREACGARSGEAPEETLNDGPTPAFCLHPPCGVLSGSPGGPQEGGVLQGSGSGVLHSKGGDSGQRHVPPSLRGPPPAKGGGRRSSKKVGTAIRAPRRARGERSGSGSLIPPRRLLDFSPPV